MTEFPLVSVIVPAFNASKYIAECIESIIAQDYPNLEIIVVDDGSSDNTYEIAKTFGKCVVVCQQTNKGAAAARNLGASVARGEWLGFNDADDLWIPGKLSAQIKYAQQHPGVNIIHGGVRQLFGKSDGTFDPAPVPDMPPTSENIVSEKSGWIYPELLLDSEVCIITAIIHRSLWEDLGGMREELRIGEDWNFFIGASRKTKIDKLDSVLSFYRIHGKSTTQTPTDTNYPHVVLLEAIKSFGLIGPDGREVSKSFLQAKLFKICFNQGILHYIKGSPKTALIEFSRSIYYSPLKPKPWIFLVLSSLKWLVHSVVTKRNRQTTPKSPRSV